jgi:hypothetical protein
MSKPIFIVRFPYYTSEENVLKQMTQIKESNIGEEYNILGFKDDTLDGGIKFECYNSEYTEIEFKALEERVLTLMDKTDDVI